MEESEEELKSLLKKVKDESEKVGLKLKIKKKKLRSWHPIPQLHGKNEETMETMSDFIFLGFKIIADGDHSHEIKRCLLLGKKAMTNPDSIFKAETLLCQQSQSYCFANLNFAV